MYAYVRITYVRKTQYRIITEVYFGRKKKKIRIGNDNTTQTIAFVIFYVHMYATTSDSYLYFHEMYT
jgi:hypothetical protein